MTFGQMLTFLWKIVTDVMALQLPVGQYRISFWQLFIYTSVLYLIMKLVFGIALGGKEKG